MGISEAGGTHPALLEAMAFGRCVGANAPPENVETLGEEGFGYDGGMGAASLRTVLERLLADPERCGNTRDRRGERVRAHHFWESVTDAYERLFRELLDQAR